MSDLRSRAIRLAASQPEGSPLRRLLASVVFDSQFGIGHPVWVAVQGTRVAGHVRAVTFTSGKVRYAVQVEDAGGPTTLHNLDSVLVEAREGERVAFGFDNFS